MDGLGDVNRANLFLFEFYLPLPRSIPNFAVLSVYKLFQSRWILTG
jgi:hypothetical protein